MQTCSVIIAFHSSTPRSLKLLTPVNPYFISPKATIIMIFFFPSEILPNLAFHMNGNIYTLLCKISFTQYFLLHLLANHSFVLMNSIPLYKYMLAYLFY